jgi:N-acetyl sugar amidotransferase
MKYCKNCVMPDTRPNQVFDDERVCDACRSHEQKILHVDWDTRKKEFDELIEKYRSKDGSNYDCIVPVSGGKDSTYQAWFMKEVYGLKVLCVSFEPTLPTEIGKQNLKNLQDMGIDLIHFRKDPETYRKLELKALKMVGDNDWPNHVGIFTVPVRVAVNYKIPLIVWGENPEEEYGGPAAEKAMKTKGRRRLEEFEMLGLRVHDMVGDGIKLQDLLPYIYPSDEEIKEAGVIGTYLGYYFKWDVPKQIKIVEEKCNWKPKPGEPMEGTFTNYEDIDCDGMVVHEYLKYVKYGFGRGTDHACNKIREGLMSREEAVGLVNKHDGKFPKNAMKRLLPYLGITKEEFFKIVKPFTNKEIFERDETGEFKRDEDDNLIKKEDCILK